MEKPYGSDTRTYLSQKLLQVGAAETWSVLKRQFNLSLERNSELKYTWGELEFEIKYSVLWDRKTTKAWEALR